MIFANKLFSYTNGLCHRNVNVEHKGQELSKNLP